MAAEGDNIIWFTYTGAEGEVIPDEATHIFVKARVVRERAFYEHQYIVLLALSYCAQRDVNNSL